MKPASLLLPLLSACTVELPIPQGKVNDIARAVCNVGHPTARYESASVVDLHTGWWSSDRSLDVAIDYKGLLAKTSKTLTVRFHVDSLDPCAVHTEVLSDTGAAPPLLLDNWVASPLVGEQVCQAFTE